MCFTGDYEWMAELCERDCAMADKPTRCGECHAMIRLGAKIHTIWLQQYEECQTCEEGECECDGECCQCSEPAFGEESEESHCDQCHKFLQAVYNAEIASGCSYTEASPPLGMMLEAIGESGAYEAEKYFKEARETYPELDASGYLAALWLRLFGKE